MNLGPSSTELEIILWVLVELTTWLCENSVASTVAEIILGGAGKKLVKKLILFHNFLPKNNFFNTKP